MISHIISYDSHNNPSKINDEVLLLFLFGRCGNRVPKEGEDLARITELVHESSVPRSCVLPAQRQCDTKNIPAPPSG